ncbi:MAG: DUF167 domain-containing protein [Candidatus Saccharibacteria bacterium]|nr:DUF167 domain-containing protein [Candidatus Saccharibacteria bacterium]
MKILVFIKPNSKSAPKIIKTDTYWTIFVKAPPIDGRANLEAAAIIAEELRLPKTAVKLKTGAASRYKTFEVDD